MKSKAILILLTVCGLGCEKGPQKVEPPCIQDKITGFVENNACAEGASVKEYEFKRDFVYVFDHGSCIADHAQTVVDYNCDTIGYLGGLTGNTEIEGKDFYKKAELQRTLFSN